MKSSAAARIALSALLWAAFSCPQALATWSHSNDLARTSFTVHDPSGPRTVAFVETGLEPSFVHIASPDADMEVGVVAGHATVARGVSHGFHLMALRTAGQSYGPTAIEGTLGSAYTDMDSLNSDEEFAFDTGVWAAIQGRIVDPLASGSPLARLRLYSEFSVSDSWFVDDVWVDGPVEIVCDFAGEPGSYARGSKMSSFRFLNPEKTAFEAFAASFSPVRRFRGRSAAVTRTYLDVEASPGVEITLAHAPVEFNRPTFGAYAATEAPEPGTLALVGLGGLACWRAAARRRRIIPGDTRQAQ